MNAFPELQIDPVYSKTTSSTDELVNQFPALYHPEAKVIWGHKDIVQVTLLAARICSFEFGWRLRVADCLRPVEAQQKMAEYDFHPRLVSRPGKGAHPHAMAVDIVPEEKVAGNWRLVDMGVPFDHFVDNPDNDNPAGRSYVSFGNDLTRSQLVFLNRGKLEFAMRRAAQALGLEIIPLQDEWWDFRFPSGYYHHKKPISEEDLLPVQRMMEPHVEELEEILDGNYPSAMQKVISEAELSVVEVWDRDFSEGRILAEHLEIQREKQTHKKSLSLLERLQGPAEGLDGHWQT